MKKAFKFFGMGGHRCKEVVKKIQILLDGELDKATEDQLIMEINRCPACLEHYKIDGAFKKLMHEKVERKCCTKSLKTEILEKIKNIEAK